MKSRKQAGEDGNSHWGLSHKWIIASHFQYWQLCWKKWKSVGDNKNWQKLVENGWKREKIQKIQIWSKIRKIEETTG